MKHSIPFLLLALSTPFAAKAADTIMPAGSIIQCTVSEPRLSSKTDKIGDPVLCTLSHAEMFGRATVPYGSYLVGQFVDYKDPGHFVGKGFMELRFDRLMVRYHGEDEIVPLDARVVAVPNYRVDQDGRILGNGKALKDTIEWLIPVLWPLDLINLPRRGPRIVLPPETRLTLKVMDDVGLPALERADYAPQQTGLQQRVPDQGYQAYAPQQLTYQQTPAPIVQAYAQPAPQTIINNYAAAPQPAPQQQQQIVIVQPPAPQYVQRPAVVYGYPPPPAYPYGYYRAYPY
jgi:hypothetical protein